MRSIGLDIHRDFCEVAIAEGGEVRSPGRIEMTPAALELFAGSLARTDQVALEVSGNAWEVARIIRPHVARLVVVSPADTGIRAARAKTDRLDARALAKLLAADPCSRSGFPTTTPARCAGAFSAAASC
jgi:transposase